MSDWDFFRGDCLDRQKTYADATTIELLLVHVGDSSISLLGGSVGDEAKATAATRLAVKSE